MRSENEKVYLSVVSPVYRAEKILPELCQRLDNVLSSITDSYEIILVDDRSPDNSWKVLKELVKKYPNLIITRLSKNFGQHYALSAGLNLSRGDWTVTLDCDLQEEPENITELLKRGKSGYDIVLCKRRNRTHSFIKQLGSKLFWEVFGLLSGFKVDSSIGTFRIMRRKVVEAYSGMGEYYRLFGGMVEWLGFETGYLEVQHCSRFEGESSYNLSRLLNLALDGIISFSNRPLLISIGVGTFISLLSGGYALYHLAYYFIVGNFGVSGWLSTVTIGAFIGGLILFNQGVIGLYLGRVYNECKRRPFYVIDTVFFGKAFPKNRKETVDFDKVEGVAISSSSS